MVGLPCFIAESNVSTVSTTPQTDVIDGDQLHQQKVNLACNPSSVNEDKIGNEYFKDEESELHTRYGTSCFACNYYCHSGFHFFQLLLNFQIFHEFICLLII